MAQRDFRAIKRPPTTVEGRGMIKVQIDRFNSGTIAAISPSIWMVIDIGLRHPHLARNTGWVCQCCGRPVQTLGFIRRIGETPQPGKILQCRCLVMIYGSPVTESQILDNWAAFRQLKNRIATRLVATKAPERN
jgi:hypothetical protein